ncbi:LuxR family transcriptional regulator [Shewanella sp. OMA3-2]|uniref:LuxR family transcriptional regulator n=1 Tax=Shewanella sp. OMA3-2 TaxID=2908650 RepID=UPI001F23D625|nr:LuxR family transcriptional regulator [Shewanella sp. OMA3-2]UJF23211.1 LuxR family transcriptional regulator [Shewanella sp. OMA3-2]
MLNDTFNIKLSEVISALNTPRFTPKLMGMISLVLRFDCAVILGYREGKRPIYLYDSIESDRELLFQYYLTTSFQHDPFYQKLTIQKQQGIFTLKDVVHKNLDYKAYCQQFYHQTGWKDELSMLIEIEPERWVMLYFGHMRDDKCFTQQQISKLKSYFCIIQSLCQQHWKQNEFNLAETVLNRSHSSTEIRESIQQALTTFGQALLTKREQEVVALIAQGFDTEDIAKQLNITQGTVKNHRKRIYVQLNVASLSELFQLFFNHMITYSRS